MTMFVAGVPFDVITTPNKVPDGQIVYKSICVDYPGAEPQYGSSDAGAVDQMYWYLWSLSGASYKTVHQRMVEKMMRLIAFHRAILNLNTSGQAVPTSPRMLDRDGLMLRAKLILEECIETIEAMGFTVRGSADMTAVVEDLGNKPDLVGIVDGCFDIKVVTTGTLSALGVPDTAGQQLVDLNNLAKFAPGFSIREDGKLIKPPGHKPPDIKGWLEILK